MSDPIANLIRAARKVNAAFNDAERFEAIGEYRLDAIWELQRALMCLRDSLPINHASAGSADQ